MCEGISSGAIVEKGGPANHDALVNTHLESMLLGKVLQVTHMQVTEAKGKQEVAE